MSNITPPYKIKITKQHMNKNKPTKKLGFSLIELSVVILIVGVLVIGVTKGSKVLSAAKLASAKSLTAGSPIATIDNLVMWLEVTSDKSFNASEKIDTTLGDTGTISSWNDLNPQTASPNNATQNVTNNKPRYVANGINGLPAVNFDGIDDYLNLPNGTVPYEDSPYTIFIVSSTNSLCICGVLGSGTSGVTYGSNSYRYDPSGFFYNYWWFQSLSTPAGSVAIKIPYIFTISYKTLDRKMYINGLLKSSDTPSGRVSTVINNAVGVTNNYSEFMNGYIGEIIIFNRSLTDTQRTDVESYLKNKWGIK